MFGKVVTSHPELAAVNFTGSVPTFQWLWKAVGENLDKYTGFPKVCCNGQIFVVRFCEYTVLTFTFFLAHRRVWG